MGDRSNTTAERRHVSPLLVLHLLRVCHFKNTREGDIITLIRPEEGGEAKKTAILLSFDR